MAKRNTSRNRDRFNRQKATWDPSEDKAQMSLAQGSEEYQEYIEDQKRNAPSAPDDKFHQELEQHDVDVRRDMAQSTAEKADEKVADRKYRMQQQKRGMISGIAASAGKVVTQMERDAAKTPSLSDDYEAKALRKKVNRLRLDREPAESVVYNDGISADKENVDNEVYLPKWMDKYT